MSDVHFLMPGKDDVVCTRNLRGQGQVRILIQRHASGLNNRSEESGIIRRETATTMARPKGMIYKGQRFSLKRYVKHVLGFSHSKRNLHHVSGVRSM